MSEVFADLLFSPITKSSRPLFHRICMLLFAGIPGNLDFLAHNLLYCLFQECGWVSVPGRDDYYMEEIPERKQ